jgi:membrane protein
MIESVKKRFSTNPVFLFILELIRRIQDDQIPQVGAMLAYHLFMSIFPFLIFFLNVLSYTPLLHTDVVKDMMEFVPYETQAILQPILLDLVRSRSGAILSVSLILALWSGSNALNQVILIMNRAFDIPDSRSFIHRRALAVLYTVLLALLLIVMLLGPVFGDAILNGLFSIIGPQEWLLSIWGWVKALIPLILLIVGFALLYRYGPAFPKEHRICFKDALIGAAVAAIGWLLASAGFSFYVNNFSNYSNTYGSLAGIIILLIWLYLSAIILLVGAEIAATVFFLRTRQEVRPTVHELVKQHTHRHQP